MRDQRDVITFLSAAENYGDTDATVECIETHGSLIFLKGDYAYKLKRAIAYAALDFVSLSNREQACHAELRLNCRTAPRLYLEVRSITREADGHLTFNGAGTVLDWVVVMRRFPQEALFDNMARTGRLTEALIQELGAEIARFHQAAERTPAYGGADGIREAILANHRELSRYPQILEPSEVETLRSTALTLLEQLADRLEQRRVEGWVRRCHGDMRLANICLFEGHPTLFDGIEFSESIACIDVLYDIAFVLMDLRHHGLAELARSLFNSYLAHTNAPGDCSPLPLFLSVRAATRCYTLACSALRQGGAEVARDKIGQARSLLRQAQEYLAQHGIDVMRSCRRCLL